LVPRAERVGFVVGQGQPRRLEPPLGVDLQAAGVVEREGAPGDRLARLGVAQAALQLRGRPEADRHRHGVLTVLDLGDRVPPASPAPPSEWTPSMNSFGTDPESLARLRRRGKALGRRVRTPPLETAVRTCRAPVRSGPRSPSRSSRTAASGDGPSSLNRPPPK